MKHHPAWLAAGLLVFVVLACNLSKNTNRNSNSTASANSQPTAEVDLGSGIAIKEIHMAKDNGNGQPGSEDNFIRAWRSYNTLRDHVEHAKSWNGYEICLVDGGCRRQPQREIQRD